jgi:hypothetical protein
LGSEYTGNSVGSGLSGRIADRRTGGFRPPSAGFPWALEQGTTARRSGNFPPGTGSPEVRERAAANLAAGVEEARSPAASTTSLARRPSSQDHFVS